MENWNQSVEQFVDYTPELELILYAAVSKRRFCSKAHSQMCTFTNVNFLEHSCISMLGVVGFPWNSHKVEILKADQILDLSLISWVTLNRSLNSYVTQFPQL